MTRRVQVKMSASHYANITKECQSCGKRSRFKLFGRLMGQCIGLPMMNIIKDRMQCPKCGIKHKYSRPPTFPTVKEGPWRKVRV